MTIPICTKRERKEQRNYLGLTIPDDQFELFREDDKKVSEAINTLESIFNINLEKTK